MDQLKNMEEKKLGRASPLIRDSVVNASKAYSNGRSRDNKYSSSPEPLARARRKIRENEEGLSCDRCG